uniref:Uncharacterized protein n=1 Tax=Meloidogyne enterolobii TaxID=390850 RepID=A0A6V7WRN0_MELEN|nr:unnamed protein product [Meloidogyne enterolobii]
MRTPKQLEEWPYSTQNSAKDETLVEEEDNFTETSSIDGLTTISSSCCSTQHINGSLKQRLKKLEEILQIKSEHVKEIEILKAANEENLKQKDESS